mmetsp:Transcript_24706/g.54409  ORF Transcript_24706/g.54409 Transcript_24706/m.54409 type:complete len:293 (-) Transcript_24706:555-1433(-)|eukprot:CAMPEP_0201135944 /NCGR_PEP_ID=MMETSP0850-20130426/54598_1 /ASSEMBLY_ACC=CAM_ASM_000622 /TAXON_ID=183588 /ORGANISM="Pseudo-nitzschia fraudulenta, Strain WWA7" /LENGTH=292 /DNA_ID=CAMNT_0047407169 /DNA_START=88 /DNA_END=966 /DNA_ORIENTATION=+
MPGFGGMEVRSAGDNATSKPTDAYHQRILRLAEEFSDAKVAWDVSQQVLDRIWNADGFAKHNTPSVADSTPIFYACQACGYRLHPGWMGTTIRVERPKQPASASVKRTIRRREQRKRRSVAFAEEAKVTDPKGRRRFSPSTVTSNSGEARGEVSGPKLVLLRDDPVAGRLQRNRLVLTCGRCRHKIFLKGLRREPKLPISNAAAGRKSLASASPADKSGVENLAEDFVALPRYRKQPPPRVAEAISKRTKPPPALSLLEQRMGRKKKKKTNQTPKNKKPGNLLNFLSSLNNN